MIVPLDFLHQVQPRLECFSSRFPTRRTDFALMLTYKTCCLKFAENFFRALADAVVVNVHGFENALGIDDKSPPHAQPGILDVSSKIAAKPRSRISDHGIGDLRNGGDCRAKFALSLVY